MSEISPVMTPQETNDRAAEWLVRKNASSTWTQSDQAALDQWLAENPAHMLAYWRLEATWQRADRLSALRKQHGSGTGPTLRQKVLGRAAFGAGIAVLLSTVWMFAPRDMSKPPGEYETGLGGHKVIVLTDGSKIELNTNTLIRLAADGNQREVWLERGEAYFQIKHNIARPFVVVAGDQRVIDVGTAFTVRRQSNRLQVALAEGRALLEPVELNSPGKPIVLNPGDVAVATSHGISVTTKSLPQISDAMAWRNGLLAFDNTPLSEVVAEFNRYNKEKLVVAGDGAAETGVGGHFRATNVEAFKRMAKNILKLRVETRGNQTIISK